MKNFESSNYSAKKELENGLIIIDEKIIEEAGRVTFEFILDRPVVDVSMLSELWKKESPNSVILTKMVELGWISENFTVLHHFKMNVSIDTSENKVKFEFYTPDSELNAGMRHVN